mmetsp:Transcript_21000/g.46026  ORF Transcript_21000/g.46026 Transcript_21000/m.46026 type:complete len:308 (-) Transcript_21000:480-1403(-)
MLKQVAHLLRPQSSTLGNLSTDAISNCLTYASSIRSLSWLACSTRFGIASLESFHHHQQQPPLLPSRAYFATSASTDAASSLTASDAATSTAAVMGRIDPRNVVQQAQLTIDRKRLSGDPGTPRYTAPYYIPEEFRTGMPRVLWTDPWQPVEDVALRRQHAALCMSHVKASSKPLTAQEVFDQINAQHGSTFGSVKYVKSLLEHLRRARFVMGKRNPAETALSHGHPNHPRLYKALPFQRAEKGSDFIIAQRKAQEERRRVAQALKRLRRSKPPYAIHRPRSHDSSFHHALAEAEVQQLMQAQQPAA